MSKFDSFLQDLTTYLKLPSLPVAVKMLRKGETPPVPAKYPLQHFKKRMVLCQAWTIAKRHEETVCMRYEDMRCAPSVLAMGFKPPMATMFNFGDVMIQTAGELPNFVFDKVPRPSEVVHIISDLSENRNGKGNE